MSRSMFGWSLPPGVRTSDIPGCGDEPPCDVCGQDLDNCICPECPVCGGVGDPFCYEDVSGHGLVRSFGQVALRAETDTLLDEESEADRRADEAAERLFYHEQYQ